MSEKDTKTLYNDIVESIEKIDESMSYKDLALVISKILKEDYGEHNFIPFIETLKKDLGL